MNALARVKSYMLRDLFPDRYFDAACYAFYACILAVLTVISINSIGLNMYNAIYAACSAGLFISAWTIATERAWAHLLKGAVWTVMGLSFLSSGYYVMTIILFIAAWGSWKHYKQCCV